jgi:hypothetical protein
MDNAVRATYGVSSGFMPGFTYHWGIFGRSGGVTWDSDSNAGRLNNVATNGAYFWKGLNTDDNTYLAISWGSSTFFGQQPAEGLFDLIIDRNAE